MLDVIKTYWLYALFSGVLSGMGLAVRLLFGRLKKEMDEQTKIKAGVIAMLHDRLYQSCQHFLRQGYIIPGDLKNIATMQESYTDLGGNGMISEMVSRVKALPLHKTEG